MIQKEHQRVVDEIERRGASGRPLKWTQAAVLDAIHEEARAGRPLNPGAVVDRNHRLYNAARARFGSWHNALDAAGYDVPRAQRWTATAVVEAIRRDSDKGLAMNSGAVAARDRKLYDAARKHCGGWRQAMRAAGVKPQRPVYSSQLTLPGFCAETDDEQLKSRDSDWLQRLRLQIGESAWGDRVQDAKRRESLVLQVQAEQHKGQSRWSAATAVAEKTPHAPSTLIRWVRSYAEAGLTGLIDRSGNLRVRSAPRPAPSGPRGRRKKEPRSFIRWVGGKSRVMHHILAAFPSQFRTYFEPMVGSGTVFLTLKPQEAVLADINFELINCYEVIRDDVDALTEAMVQHENTESHYLEIRALDPDKLPRVQRAARMIYLNKTCFNGLYRVNRKGRFNVPYGNNPDVVISDGKTLRRVSQALQGVQITCADVHVTVKQAQRNDLVYLDPPYLPSKAGKKVFRDYQPTEFGEEEHVALAELFRKLDARGCHVVLSNSDTPTTRQLYRGYNVTTISARRSVSAAVEKRGRWRELLIDNTR